MLWGGCFFVAKNLSSELPGRHSDIDSGRQDGSASGFGFDLFGLTDAASAEIYSNDGLVLMDFVHFPEDGAILRVFSSGGEMTSRTLGVYELKSIWK